MTYDNPTSVWLAQRLARVPVSGAHWTPNLGWHDHTDEDTGGDTMD